MVRSRRTSSYRIDPQVLMSFYVVLLRPELDQRGDITTTPESLSHAVA